MREQEYKPCEHCGAETEKFYVQKGTGYITSEERRFCNGSCSNRSRSTPKTCLKTNCKTCGVEIDAKQSLIKNGKKYFKQADRKYCSLSCVGKSKQKTKERDNIKNRTIRPRLIKKKTVKISSCSECCNFYTQKNAKKYCSKECKIKAKTRLENEKYIAIKTDLVEKSGGACSLCKKEFELSSYCFHHLRDKKFTLDAFTIIKKTTDEILLEYEKCQLLCHNCHAIHHEKERRTESINKFLSGLIDKNNYIRRRRCIVLKKKLIKLAGGCCEDCGFSSKYTQCMSFDHIDPDNKIYELNTCNISRYSWDKTLLEFEKCRLLCLNCHIGKNPSR
jgi:hypothetical protein